MLKYELFFIITVVNTMAARFDSRSEASKAGKSVGIYKTFGPFGEWRSWLAHLVWDQGVAGSNPVSPILISLGFWLGRARQNFAV